MTNMNGADRLRPEATFEPSHAARTEQTYRSHWAAFTGFCESLRLQSLPASPDTVLAYLGAAKTGSLRVPGNNPRMTGSPTSFSASHVDVALAAIRDRHLRADLRSPTADPAVRAVRKQYRIDWDTTHGTSHATPLTVDALRACVEHRPDVPLPALTKAVAALVLADHADISARDLSPLRLTDLRCARQVQLRIGGHWRPIACTCTDFAAHWQVRPCAACLLRQLETELDDENQMLFDAWPHTRTGPTRDAEDLKERILVLGRSLPAAWPALRYAGSGRMAWLSDDEQLRAATRHGVGLVLTQQMHVLQIKTLLNVSFARGLRFSDAQRLGLETATRLPDGYRLLLPASKGDQPGRGRWLHLYPASECSLCPVCALDEWLWVRSAAAPPTAPAPLLLCGIGPIGLRPDRRLDYATTWSHLTPIREASRAGNFSLHSMRRGFAALAQEQGATDHQIQQALGHRKLDTTKRYLDRERTGQIPPALQRLAGGTPPSAPNPEPETRATRMPHEHADHVDPDGARCIR